MRPKAIHILPVATLVMVLPVSLPSQNHAARYWITDLGIVGGPPGQPFHITNNGLVSGSSALTVKGEQTEQAWLWFRGFKRTKR